jgi:hypothetical protein
MLVIHRIKLKQNTRFARKQEEWYHFGLSKKITIRCVLQTNADTLNSNSSNPYNRGDQ